MSVWTDAVMNERISEARSVYEKLAALEWSELSEKDRALREALGYMALERDEIRLKDLCDADLGDDK